MQLPRFKNLPHSCHLSIGLWLAASGAAFAYDGGRFALPPDKSHIDPCREQTLLRHPGTITQQRIVHQPPAFWIRYTVEMVDGTEWLMVCDLADGNILYGQMLLRKTL